ncbi:alpha/beta hydrolase [soil metagenome]
MLNYKSTGQGVKKIIFVHGNSQSAEYWDQILNQSVLSDQWTLIAVDLPGHGKSFRSSDPEKDYSMKGMANHLREFLAHFEQEEYVLVGNSFGTNLIGEIALELRNCKGIMLTAADIIGKGLSTAEIIQPNPNVLACFIAEPSQEQIDSLVSDAVWNLSEELMARMKIIFRHTDPAFRLQIADSIGRAEYSDEILNLENSKLPVCVLFGEKEKLIFPDYLDKINFKYWRNKTIIIKDSGHCSQLDQPIILAEHIREFAIDCLK